MTKIAYNVCVLTVTYGNRWDFLQQVLKRVLSFEVNEVVVVDNGSSYDLAKRIENMSEQTITLLQQEENIGSAGGYKVGLEYIFSSGRADFIWLLDDDNVPDTGALSALLTAWPTIHLPENRKALYSLRLDRSNHIKVAQGSKASQYYLVPDNFMGFHLFRIFQNQYRKLTSSVVKNPLPLKPAKLPYVPYGGLFIHKNLLSEIGYPDERFFVYVDDSDYTYRITAVGGAIWLIPASTIRDIDSSQGIHYQSRFWRSPILDLWNFRTYYQVRNRLYFYSRHAIQNKFIFALNKSFYLFGLYIISILTGKRKAYRAFKGAVADGIKGNLGKKEFKPLQ